MRVISTRGLVTPMSFEEALFTSYTSDGGMTMPEFIPQLTTSTLEKWRDCSYREIVKKVVGLFVSEDEIPPQTQHHLIDEAFKKFDFPAVVKTTRLRDGLNVLELWHGQTMAFKDLAMTCTAQFVAYFLRKRNKHMTAVILTSGDTGSSALYAVKDVEEISSIVIFPHGMVSAIQRRMICTVHGPRVHVFAVEESLESLESYFIRMTSDQEFVEENCVGTLNSLNWCRIMVQVAHHIYAYLQVVETIGDPVDVIIPSGGCGNITACMLARAMGVPVRPTCVTNANDSLHRILRHNDWSRAEVTSTLAPAMNMTFLTNFERIVWMMSGQNSKLVRELMSQYNDGICIELDQQLHSKMTSAIRTSVARDDVIGRAMHKCWHDNSYAVCPHTATAVAHFYGMADGDVTHRNPPESKIPSICIATAAAEKFPDILTEVGIPQQKSERVEKLLQIEEKFTLMRRGEKWEDDVTEKIQAITRQVRSETVTSANHHNHHHDDQPWLGNLSHRCSKGHQDMFM